MEGLTSAKSVDSSTTATLSSPVSLPVSSLSHLQLGCVVRIFCVTATIKVIIFNFRSSPL